MKLVQVHNRYRVRGGEDTAVDATVRLLRSRGVEVREFFADSWDVPSRFAAHLALSLRGVYSRAAYGAIRRLMQEERPDIVHVHNLYPLFSPSVLGACRREGIPIVMTCHNYRLICPIGTLFSHGEVCERCTGCHEFACVLRNCTGNVAQSAAYALRNAVARRFGLFLRNVTLFIVPTEFVRRKLSTRGLAQGAFCVVPHSMPCPAQPVDCSSGRYVACVGRASPEKGLPILLGAAARCPDLPVRVAGDHWAMSAPRPPAPGNVQFLGPLPHPALKDVYAGARFLVMPSMCFETFGLAAAEAMAYGLPVIAARIGGLPEVVDDGVTGLLFEPGNAQELSEKMRFLWDHPSICSSMGQAARKKAMREYNEEAVFHKLTAAYSKAMEIHGRRRRNEKPAG